MSESIFVDQINVGHRYRTEDGDLQALANSIKKHGLLQPIVVAKQDHLYRLVAGKRRLKVVRDILHRTKIEASIVDLAEGVPSLEAERDENEERKEFTVSERVAIGQAIEEKMGNRAGRPKLGQEKPNLTFGGGKTEEIASEKAGFESRSTYQNAKNVVANGVPELVQAMDQGEVSVSDAAAVTKAPEAVQKKALKLVKKKKAKTLREAVDEELKKEDKELTLDELIKEENSKLESFCRKLMKLVEEELPTTPWFNHRGQNRRESAIQKFKDGCSTIRAAKCHGKCPMCQGGGCKDCHNSGRVTLYAYQQLV